MPEEIGRGVGNARSSFLRVQWRKRCVGTEATCEAKGAARQTHLPRISHLCKVGSSVCSNSRLYVHSTGREPVGSRLGLATAANIILGREGRTHNQAVAEKLESRFLTTDNVDRMSKTLHLTQLGCRVLLRGIDPPVLIKPLAHDDESSSFFDLVPLPRSWDSLCLQLTAIFSPSKVHPVDPRRTSADIP
ncbi:hypothetical protein LZ30DRAFT_195248 [Colletotrichum cereale]|nr:hypothetical protein LZ30DRAFT_195248 [Colletotrichum cereale]